MKYIANVAQRAFKIVQKSRSREYRPLCKLIETNSENIETMKKQAFFKFLLGIIIVHALISYVHNYDLLDSYEAF